MYFVFRDNEEYDRVPAFHEAQHLAVDVMGDEAPDGHRPVYTVRNRDGSVLDSFTHGRIVAHVHRQAEGLDRKVVVLGVDRADVTDAVLDLDHARLLRLEDPKSAESLALVKIDWPGTYEVHVAKAVARHFGVRDLSDVSATHLGNVRLRLVGNAVPDTETQYPFVGLGIATIAIRPENEDTGLSKKTGARALENDGSGSSAD